MRFILIVLLCLACSFESFARTPNFRDPRTANYTVSIPETHKSENHNAEKAIIAVGLIALGSFLIYKAVDNTTFNEKGEIIWKRF